jgi:hypothetical protein
LETLTFNAAELQKVRDSLRAAATQPATQPQ